ncbi:glycosyltransferase family 52 protein, partial [Glaesserella parasuis]|nr:glycosyltransferase family 52 protein [Glaesserella parasuis]
YSCTNKVVLFVGQPIYEMDKTGEYKITEHIRTVNKLIDKLDVDYFFPHPRENNFLSVKNKYIETVKVFEDFFFERYSQNTDYVIYTFFSGAVISLIGLPNVKINLIKIKDFPTDLSNIYEMMQDNFNFSIVEVEND